MANNVKNTSGAKVWVNGIEIRMVTEFNQADGWVEAFSTSPTNYSNVDLSALSFVTSKIYGHVEVEYQ